MTHDEEIAALCLALDKAHELLAFVVRYDGKTTPEFVKKCQDWVEGEYSPCTGVKPCDHIWKKAAIDSSVSCILCGVAGGDGDTSASRRVRLRPLSSDPPRNVVGRRQVAPQG